MAKLDVGVGDEFPARDVGEDEGPEVHHHHYYRRYRGYRRPGGWLRVILWIVLISTFFRLLNYLTNPWSNDWGGRHGPAYGWWDGPAGAPFFPVSGMIGSVLIVAFILWLLRGRDGTDAR